MKIKADFVTNSSSTMYVIEFNKEFLRKDFEKYMQLRTGEYFNFFRDKFKLIKYTQQEDVDWITEATKAPLKYWGMSRDEFNIAIKIFDDGNFPVYAQIDRNYVDRREKAEFIIMENGGTIRYTGSD